ncbi:MAG: alpha/beta fold hydrolase [Paracoccaceae bacterium]
MRTETIDLGGKPFFLRRWGDPDKPVLLMLHGFPEYGGAWEDLALHLADHFHCIAPDQRGYGQSWAPPEVENYTGSALTGDMALLIERFGGRATVLGHDWGAAVAYGLAMFRGDLVDRLIILNGVHPVPFQRALASGGPQTEASQYINFLRRPDSHEKFAANNYQKLIDFFAAKMNFDWLTGERLEQYRTEWARPGKLNTMINWYRASPLQVPPTGERIDDLPEWPPEKLTVRCPHLLIWGLEDRALLPEATEGLEEFAPDLTRIEMSGVDHWLCHQKPAEIAAHILNWSAA